MFPNFHFSIERWRKNEEYGVWVSTHGRIRLIQNKEFLNTRIDKSGYCVVFTNKGLQFVHRLVAYTWLGGKRNEKYSIDHINSNKRDNSVKNLRWIECELNTTYARYTRTNEEIKDCDIVPCIEADEKLLEDLKNPNPKIGRVALEKLFDNKKIVLIAGETIISTKEQLYNFVGAKKDTPYSGVLGNIFRAIIKKEMLHKCYWMYKEVSK